MFLDGHIREVNKHVVQLTGAGRVFHRAESAEAKFVPEEQPNERERERESVVYTFGMYTHSCCQANPHVALQRPIGGHQHVEAQVKFLSSYQQRVVDVQGDDVGLFATRSCYEPEITQGAMSLMCRNHRI